MSQRSYMAKYSALIPRVSRVTPCINKTQWCCARDRSAHSKFILNIPRRGVYAVCTQRRCQLANTRSRSRNSIPGQDDAFVRDSLLHFFVPARRRVSHSEGNTLEASGERANAFPYSYRPLSPTMLRDKYRRETN